MTRLSGIPQLISNINACGVVGDILRTTLGPRGMDKLIHQERQVTISNDGATIIKMLDIVHPAAKTLVDIARSQDAMVSVALPRGSNERRLAGWRWNHQCCSLGM